jgi:hypothetical protein
MIPQERLLSLSLPALSLSLVGCFGSSHGPADGGASMSTGGDDAIDGGANGGESGAGAIDGSTMSDGGANGGEGGSSIAADGSGCPTAPAAAPSPPSSASGMVVSDNGAAIDIQDGYAYIDDSYTATATPSYASLLHLVFTDYPNAFGYADVDGPKQGSRVLRMGNFHEQQYEDATWIYATSTAPAPPITAGTYAVTYDSGGAFYVWEYSSSCQGQGVSVGQVNENIHGTLTISSITETRIQGTFAGAYDSAVSDAAVGSVAITFDVPLVVYAKAGNELGGSSACGLCLP